MDCHMIRTPSDVSTTLLDSPSDQRLSFVSIPLHTSRIALTLADLILGIIGFLSFGEKVGSNIIE